MRECAVAAAARSLVARNSCLASPHSLLSCTSSSLSSALERLAHLLFKSAARALVLSIFWCGAHVNVKNLRCNESVSRHHLASACLLAVARLRLLAVALALALLCLAARLLELEIREWTATQSALCFVELCPCQCYKFVSNNASRDDSSISLQFKMYREKQTICSCCRALRDDRDYASATDSVAASMASCYCCCCCCCCMWWWSWSCCYEEAVDHSRGTTVCGSTLSLNSADLSTCAD